MNGELVSGGTANCALHKDELYLFDVDMRVDVNDFIARTVIITS